MEKTLRTILVVDNEDGFHQILRMLFEPMGFRVDSAYDGEAGWNLFQTRNYDLVFSDVHMPKMRGPELLDHIRSLKPEQKVVMMTSGSDPDGRFELSLRGNVITECLYKPFEIDEAIQAADKLIGVKVAGAV